MNNKGINFTVMYTINNEFQLNFQFEEDYISTNWTLSEIVYDGISNFRLAKSYYKPYLF